MDSLFRIQATALLDQFGLTPRQDVLDALVAVDRAAFLPEDQFDEVVAFSADYVCFMETQAMDLVRRAEAKKQALREAKNDAGEEMQRKIDSDLDQVLAGMMVDFMNHFSTPITVPVRAVSHQHRPLPIGYNQTCTDPSLVAATMVLADLQPGQRVLEVGLGCGYSAAVALQILGEKGHLVSVERIPLLYEFGKANLEKHLGAAFHDRVTLVQGDGSAGYSGMGPYDRVYLTAGVTEQFQPQFLAAQLQEEGILVYPYNQFIRQRYVRGEMVEEKRVGRVAFVPLIGANGAAEEVR